MLSYFKMNACKPCDNKYKQVYSVPVTFSEKLTYSSQVS